MPTAPTIIRIHGRLFVDAAVGRCEIKPSHDDRRKPRWWTLIGPDGKPLSPAVAAPRIAAAWAVAKGA